MSDRKKPTGEDEPPSFVGMIPLSRAPTPPDSPRHPIGTPRGLSTTGGVVAVSAWLSERGLFPPQGKPWHIEITLDATVHNEHRVFAERIDTRLQITVMPSEWRYYFAHAGRISAVHVTDQARAGMRDDYALASATPTLRGLGAFVRQLEQRFNVVLIRHQARVVSTLPGAEPNVRAWVTTL